MNIAFLGCGYVAGLYAQTLPNHPVLRLVGAFDRDAEALGRFVGHVPVRAYDSFAGLLGDPGVDLVVNLTNPRAHAQTTQAALEAGKHVYSEKPLALTATEARDLVDLARRRKLLLASAPCSVLGPSAQALWKAVREGAAGTARLVYASFDDGLDPVRMRPWTWTNGFGAPWPARDEFEVGCTVEHAGYLLTWLAAMFGPVRRVTSFAACLLPDKGIAVAAMAPDFTVGCLEYDRGVVARVTSSLMAPHDKSLTVIGDLGALVATNVRNDRGPILLRPARPGPWASRLARHVGGVRRFIETRLPTPAASFLSTRRLPLAGPRGLVASPGKPVDFLRGPAEMAEAFRDGRPCRLSAELAAHVAEVVEALQHPERFGGSKTIHSEFAPIDPMDWSR